MNCLWMSKFDRFATTTVHLTRNPVKNDLLQNPQLIKINCTEY